MTRDEIITKWTGMTAREKDAWVAKVIFERFAMSYADDDDLWIEAGGVGTLSSFMPLPMYSTDVSAAWAVFEWFPYVEVARIPGPVTTYGVRINDPDDGRICAMTKEPTFPEAICLAALIAQLTEVFTNESA